MCREDCRDDLISIKLNRDVASNDEPLLLMEKTELLSCKLRLEDRYQLGDSLYSCPVES